MRYLRYRIENTFETEQHRTCNRKVDTFETEQQAKQGSFATERTLRLTTNSRGNVRLFNNRNTDTFEMEQWGKQRTIATAK